MVRPLLLAVPWFPSPVIPGKKAGSGAAARLLEITCITSIRISPRFRNDYSTRAALAGRGVPYLKYLKYLRCRGVSKRPRRKGFEKSLHIEGYAIAHRRVCYLHTEGYAIFHFSWASAAFLASRASTARFRLSARFLLAVSLFGCCGKLE